MAYGSISPRIQKAILRMGRKAYAVTEISLPYLKSPWQSPEQVS